MGDKAKTDILGTGISQIPFEAENRIGRIFVEGAAKHGMDNWRKGVGDRAYQLERLEHAIAHLKVYAHWLQYGEYLGQTKDGQMEDDLAKVGWFVVTQAEIERLEKKETQ